MKNILSYTDPVPYYTDGKSDITEVEIQLGKMVDVNGRHRHKVYFNYFRYFFAITIK